MEAAQAVAPKPFKPEPREGSPTILDPARMGLVEEGARQDFVVTAESGTTIAMVMKPEFWANTAGKLSQFDHIEVRCEDGRWVADFLVLSAGRNWARLHLKAEYKLETSEAALTVTPKHQVKNRGPHLKWCVIRLADNQPVMEKMDSESAAVNWMREHERAST